MVEHPLIHLTSFEQEIVHRLALARHENARLNKIKDRRMGRQSAYQTDLEGCAAEIALCKHFGCYPDFQLDVRPDYDLILPCGLTVDTKCTRYQRGHLLVVKWKTKKKLPDLYALAVGSFPGPYKFCGFILAVELLVPSRLQNFGYGEGYAAKQRELYDLDEVHRRRSNGKGLVYPQPKTR